MSSGKPFFYRNTLRAIIAGCLLSGFISCTTVKKYQPGKPFVYKTNIIVTGNFTNKEESDNLASRLKGQLDDSLSTRSVSKLLFSHITSPPLYDSANAEKSVLFMRALLVALGYFEDTIIYDTSLKIVKDQYRTTVNFHVKLGKVVTLDSISYNIKQEDLQQITLANRQTSFLKKGDPFAKATISVELDRLVQLYRDNGYLRFTRDELIGVWDTLDVSLLKPTFDPFEQLEQFRKLKDRENNPKANLEIRLKPGFDSTKLIKYYVGNITVYPDYSQDTAYTRKEVMTDGVKVIYYRKIFKPWILPQNIYFRRGDLYQQKRYLQTINQFNALGAWGPTDIQQLPRKNQDTVDFAIRLSPALKYSFTTNPEVSRNQTAISGNLFGLGINVGLQNRNFLKAANKASTNVRYGIELGQNAGEQFIQTQQVVLSHNIYFPRSVPNLKFIPHNSSDKFRSVLSFNLANTDRKDLYKVVTVNGSWGYEYQWNKKFISLRIPNIEYSYLVPRSQLDTLFNNNPSLRNIFTDGFISSVLATFTVSGGKKKNLNVFRTNMEGSGLLTGLIRSKFLDTNLYRYLKIDGEFTRKIQYKKTVLAMRLFGGMGYEFNSTVNPMKRNNLPFFKQYFAGGPNSMRGWGLRKLGPGSVIKEFTGSSGIPERYGDIQLEGNLEYRFPISTIGAAQLNGAVFTDVGNVWLMKKEAGPPEEVFNFNRLGKDLGVDAGIGLRIDLSFFVIRFDYAYKVKDPSPKPEDALLQNKWFGYKFPNGTQFQLGISYPFIL